MSTRAPSLWVPWVGCFFLGIQPVAQGYGVALVRAPLMSITYNEKSPSCFHRLKLITKACLPVMMEERGLFSHLFKAPEPSMSQAMCRDALLIFP